MNSVISDLIVSLGDSVLLWFSSDVGRVFVGLFAVMFCVRILMNFLNL